MPTVIGAILEKWMRLGGPASFLGQPLTDELTTPDGVGRFNHFQGGSIYWTPGTGAQEVHGAIRDKWASIGWERSVVGYPVTDETGTPDGVGRFNHFQAGSIYWTPNTGAHEVHGAIRNKWASLGWERSFLRYPVTDELTTPDGMGRFTHFEGGSIYWTPQTAAHEIHGAIRDKWASMGWERSVLRYPTSDELGMLDGRVSHFEHGSIKWTPSGGAVIEIAQGPSITLRAISDQGRFIEVSGSRFSIGSNVKLSYGIHTSATPTTHTFGEDVVGSDGHGNFIHRIRVTLAGDIAGANVQATDIASGLTATASL